MSYESSSFGVVSQQGLRERLFVLRSSDLFETFDDAALLLLAEHATAGSYRAGQTISDTSDAPRAVFVVTAGSVTLRRNAREVTFAAGSTFGVMELLARQPLGLARADQDTRTLEIPAAAVEAALDESFSALRSTLRIAGAAVLGARGNLPVDPLSERKLDEGTFHDQPRSFVERLIELRSGPFGYMNVEALVDLARHMREVRVAKGQVIWSVGDASTHAFHIDYGRVRCTSSDGRHVDVGRGFTIGVLDVWTSEGRAYGATAETIVIGFHVDFEDFLTLLETHVEVGLDILRGFARALLEQAAPGR